jgi:CBS domain-containing protein
MSNLPRHRTVSDVMTSHVHVAAPMTPFKVLARVIDENRISAIPIVDEQGMPIGIVSEADLLLKERGHELKSSRDLLHGHQRQTERFKTGGTIASELMTSPPITIAAHAPLSEAARMMQQKNTWHLVVIDERGRIAGIVSRSDLLQLPLRTDDDLRDEISVGHTEAAAAART